jgi:hypothetical protein
MANKYTASFCYDVVPHIMVTEGRQHIYNVSVMTKVYLIIGKVIFFKNKAQ